MLVFLSI